MIHERVKKVLSEKGWSRTFYLSDLLDGWRSFVNSCEEGYQDNIYEYNNDISLRNAIQIIIDDEVLSKVDGIKNFGREVQEIDDKFQKLLFKDIKRPNYKNWWESGILKKAGEEYVNDIKNEYGVNIELV